MALWTQAERSLNKAPLALWHWTSHFDLSSLSFLISRTGFVIGIRDNICKLLEQFLAHMRIKDSINGRTQVMWE